MPMREFCPTAYRWYLALSLAPNKPKMLPTGTPLELPKFKTIK